MVTTLLSHADCPSGPLPNERTQPRIGFWRDTSGSPIECSTNGKNSCDDSSNSGSTICSDQEGCGTGCSGRHCRPGTLDSFGLFSPIRHGNHAHVRGSGCKAEKREI